MKLPNIAHLCGEPLSFETRDGVSWERCASCHYEAPVPRRAPSKDEAEARRVAMGIRRERQPGKRRGPKPKNPEAIAPIVGRVVAEIMDTIEAQQERTA